MNLLNLKKTVVASSALLLATTHAQRLRLGKVFTTSENVEEAHKLFGCGYKNFEYTDFLRRSVTVP